MHVSWQLGWAAALSALFISAQADQPVLQTLASLSQYDDSAPYATMAGESEQTVFAIASRQSVYHG